MLKAAAERGWLNEKDAAMEALQCFRRAGADLILTYYSLQAAKWMVSGPRPRLCTCCGMGLASASLLVASASWPGVNVLCIVLVAGC